jgi:hypothetical protein
MPAKRTQRKNSADVVVNPFTGKIIKEGGATMNKLEELASKKPAEFMKKLVELGWTEADAIRAAKLWARQQRIMQENPIISVDDFKDKQNDWFEFLQERALSKQWTEIHQKAESWSKWIFPHDAPVCAKLGNDCSYMRNYGLCVYIVLEAWGWDPVNNWKIDHAWPEQKWHGDQIDIELIVLMVRSCVAFGKKSLARLCIKFAEELARHNSPNGGKTLLKRLTELAGPGFFQVP